MYPESSVCCQYCWVQLWLFTLALHNMRLIKSLFQILWGTLRKNSSVSLNWSWGSGMEDGKNHSSCFQWKVQLPTQTACALPIQLTTFSTLYRNLLRFSPPKPWHQCNHRMLWTKHSEKVMNHWYQWQHYEISLKHTKVQTCSEKSYITIVLILPPSEVTNEEVSMKTNN